MSIKEIRSEKVALPRDGWQAAILIALAALSGAGVAHLVGVPAASLSGAMVGAGLLVFFGGFGARIPTPAVTLLFTFLGVSMGAGVTPDALAKAHSWPLSLALMALGTVAVTLAVYAYLVHAMNWERKSAYFSAMPGALSYVLAIMQEARGDVGRVAQSQSLRVFLLIAILPSIVVMVGHGHAAVPQVQGPPAGELTLMFLAGLAGAFIGVRLKLPAGALVGAFLASAALHGADVVHGRPPRWMMEGGFIILGTYIALRFQGIHPREVARNLMASLGAFVVALAVAGATAMLASHLLSIPLGQTMIAFAPGGIEAMVMLAFMMDLDPAYVAVHQLGRFLLMLVLVPVMARFVLGRGWRDTR